MSILLRLRGFASKHRPLTVLLCLVLAVIVFFAVKSWIEMPTDLGPKLQYVGQEQLGCLPFPLSFACPERQYSVYYFATDLSAEELRTYFKKATYLSVPSDGGGSSADYTFANLHFQLNDKGADQFVLAYYDNTKVIEQYPLANATKFRHAVSIDASEYQLAKESL